MRAIRLHAAGRLQLHEEPVPRPAKHEALIQVRAVGLCGSDLHWFLEESIGDARLTHPLVLGHEFAGVIAAGPRRGERVAVDPAVACQSCIHCREGNPNLCTKLRFAGHDRQDGALREFLAWPTDCLHSVPEALSDLEAAMLEPLGVALHSLDLAHVRPGCSVGVFGCGPIGLLIVQLARVAGATLVAATDRLDHRLKAATVCGANAAFFAANGREVEEMGRLAGPGGLDVVIEAAGDNEAVEAAIEAVRPGGQVVLAGIPGDDRTSFRASTARRKGLTIRLARRMKHSYPRALRLALSGKVGLKTVVSHRFALDEFDRAFSVASNRTGLKVIVEPG